jgi:O-antigen/teichoic acid export membrane protein
VAFIRQGLDRYIINANFSIEEVGLFSFAMNLANIIMTIGLGFNQTNSIEIYKVLGDNSFSTEVKKRIITSQRKKLSTVYLVAALIVVVVCMPTIPLILPKYADAMRISQYWQFTHISSASTCYIQIICFFIKRPNR